MKAILVPVMSAADVPAIPNLVKYLKAQGPEAVVVVSAPSVGIAAEDATKEVDKRIAELSQAETAAAARKDYAGAQQFATQVEEAKLSRQEILRNGWKSVPQPQREQSYAKLVEPFAALAPAHVRHRVLVEDPENPLAAIAGMNGNWPDCLPKSEFAIVFPRSVGGRGITEVVIQASDKKLDSGSSKPVDPKEARRKELGRYFTMKKAAETHGIPYEGRKSVEVVADILKKEGLAA